MEKVYRFNEWTIIFTRTYVLLYPEDTPYWRESKVKAFWEINYGKLKTDSLYMGVIFYHQHRTPAGVTKEIFVSNTLLECPVCFEKSPPSELVMMGILHLINEQEKGI